MVLTSMRNTINQEGTTCPLPKFNGVYWMEEPLDHYPWQWCRVQGCILEGGTTVPLAVVQSSGVHTGRGDHCTPGSGAQSSGLKENHRLARE